MPLFLAPFSIWPFHHRYPGFSHRLIAPLDRDRCLSGMMNSSSYTSMLPNPLHSGHAHMGWLNEKSIGDGSGSTTLQSSHIFWDEKFKWRAPELLKMITFSLSLPSLHAISIESDSLGSSLTTSLSRTTSNGG